MSPYLSALTDAMAALSLNPRALFVGQSVAYPGTAMHQTFASVPRDRLIETPVFENTQLGLCTGLALAGDLPIAVFPRINFLLCAIDQLILHLDALPRYSRGGYNPRVIIRTAVAHDAPLNPGHQHLGDYSDAIEQMLRTVRVVRLRAAAEIVPAYRAAAERDGSTLLVEYAARYDNE